MGQEEYRIGRPFPSDVHWRRRQVLNSQSEQPSIRHLPARPLGHVADLYYFFFIVLDSVSFYTQRLITWFHNKRRSSAYAVSSSWCASIHSNFYPVLQHISIVELNLRSATYIKINFQGKAYCVRIIKKPFTRKGMRRQSNDNFQLCIERRSQLETRWYNKKCPEWCIFDLKLLSDRT